MQKRMRLIVLSLCAVLLGGCGNEMAEEMETTEVIESEVDIEALKKLYNESFEGMLQAWDSGYIDVRLDDALDALKRENIVFTVSFNYSGERIDIELEDGRKLMFIEWIIGSGEYVGHILVMKDGVLDSECFKVRYLQKNNMHNAGYFVPQFIKEKVNKEWLEGMNQTNLYIMQNEVYAKYGKKFEDPFLNELFSTKKWYEPIYSPQEFDALGQDLFTEIEKANLALLKEEEIARGYRRENGEPAINVQKAVSGAWYDLDGDGTYEQVLYEKEEMFYDRWIAASIRVLSKEEVNAGKKEGAHARWEADYLHDDCYVFSMDGKIKYLAMGDYGPSADDSMKVYQYRAGELKEVGLIYDDPSGIKVYPDYIEAYERYDHICSQYIDFTYVIKNEKFEKRIEDYYEYYPNADITALRDIVLYKEKDLNSEPITIKGGESVEMIGGDLVEWVLFKKVETGEEGWLYVKECKCMLPDGSMVYSDDVFEGLYYFG